MITMETINDRMEMLVNERFGGNKAAFAKAIDLTPTAISSYLGTKRRSKPSVEMVTNIVTKLNVDAYWLLTGEKREQDNVAVNGSHNQVNDDGAQGNINGAGVDVALLHERIKAMDLYTVSKILGHTSIKSTQIYAKVVDGMKRKAVDNVPELGKI